MKKTITIGDMDIVIRRLKMRQIKPLLSEGTEKLTALFALFDGAGEDIITPLMGFVTDNLDWLVSLAASQTDQEAEALEELDMLEFARLCSEIVQFNIPDIDLEKLKAFIQPPQPIEKAEEAEAALAAMTFGEALPAAEVQPGA